MYIFSLYILSFVVDSTCFDENEITTFQTYIDSDDAVPMIGKLRLHSGGWDSQAAVNELFRILVEEKLGIKTEYFPPLETPGLDLDADFDHEWGPSDGNIYHWYNNSQSDPDSSQNPYRDFSSGLKWNYWNDYEWWCENDHIDLFMHMNSFHVSDTLGRDYTYAKDIYHLPNGISEKQAFFVPYQIWNNTDCLNHHLFDSSFSNFSAFVPRNETGDKAIIYASLPSYWMNQKKEDQMRHFGIDEEWEIQYLGSDILLLEKLEELDALGQPYVYISYAPSIQTSFTDAKPLNFPYNPSGSLLDPCVRDGECAVAQDSIQKGYCMKFTREHSGNLHYYVMQLWDQFSLSRTEVEKMLHLYVQGSTMEESVCSWAKNDTGRNIWEPWIAEIVGLSAPKESTFKAWEKMLTFVGSGLLILMIIFCLGMLWYLKEHQPEKVARLHVQLTALWLLALIMLMTACPFLVLDITAGNCVTFYVILQFALSFVYAIPALKAWRISRWFQSSSFALEGVKNWQLYLALALVAIIDTALVIPYGITMNKHGIKIREQNVNTNDYTIDKSCAADGVTYIVALSFMWQFLLVVSLFYFAWKSRNAWDRYNEAKWLGGMALFGLGMLVFIGVLGNDTNITHFTWRKINIPFTFLCVVVLLGSYIVANFWDEFRNRKIVNSFRTDMDNEVDDIMMYIGRLTEDGLQLLRSKLKKRRELDRHTYMETVRSRKKAETLAENEHLVSELLTSKFSEINDSQISIGGESTLRTDDDVTSQASVRNMEANALIGKSADEKLPIARNNSDLTISICNESPASLKMPKSASLEMEPISPKNSAQQGKLGALGTETDPKSEAELIVENFHEVERIHIAKADRTGSGISSIVQYEYYQPQLQGSGMNREETAPSEVSNTSVETEIRDVI